MKHNILGELNKAADRAFGEMNTTFGFQTDPHLARYQQMTPQDFATIEKRYGTDGLLQYITAMESRKMKGG